MGTYTKHELMDLLDNEISAADAKARLSGLPQLRDQWLTKADQLRSIRLIVAQAEVDMT